MDIKKKAADIFSRYSHKDKLYFTSDGNPFFEEIGARNHTVNEKLKDKTIAPVSRTDFKKGEIEAVAAGRAQVISKNTADASAKAKADAKAAADIAAAARIKADDDAKAAADAQAKADQAAADAKALEDAAGEEPKV